MIAARVVLVACLALTGISCHLPVCYDVNYDAGERFQLTVVGRQTTTVEPSCDFAALAPGDTLTIVAGDLAFTGDGCAVRGARPEVPAFAKDVVSTCEGVPTQLGQQCYGATCQVSTSIFSPFIQRADQRVEGAFRVYGSGACATEMGYCSDRYDVHIERLPPG